ncbi:VOC family protein [Streptomyces sp. 372A]
MRASESYPQRGVGGEDFGGPLTMGGTFPPQVPSHWLPYSSSADVDATAAAARSAGGELLTPPTDIPYGPRAAVDRDAQGAAFGVHRAADVE